MVQTVQRYVFCRRLWRTTPSQFPITLGSEAPSLSIRGFLHRGLYDPSPCQASRHPWSTIAGGDPTNLNESGRSRPIHERTLATTLLTLPLAEAALGGVAVDPADRASDIYRRRDRWVGLLHLYSSKRLVPVLTSSDGDKAASRARFASAEVLSLAPLVKPPTCKACRSGGASTRFIATQCSTTATQSQLRAVESWRAPLFCS